MAWNFGDEVQIGGGECHGARYITRSYYIVVEAGFYNDVVECLPLDPLAKVRFPPRAVGIFLYPVTFGSKCNEACICARLLV